MKRNGFTLLELLVVISIIAVLVTLGSRIVRVARVEAKKAQAGVEMKSIETAVKAYMNKYGKLPIEDALQGQADPAGDESLSRDIIRRLNGGNTAGIVFLEPQYSDGESDGTFLDPWGEQYLIFPDGDYDGSVVVSTDGFSETVHRKAAVVSIGLHRLNGADGTNDYVVSWR